MTRKNDVLTQWQDLTWTACRSMDSSRRLLGEWLDRSGFGPRETPYETVFTAAGLELRHYGGPAAGPVVLILPAPIKAAYIWDAAPRISVVRRLIDGGCQVYLAAWTRPGAEERQLGLADYADRLIRECLEVIASETETRSVFIAGHSLGGTFAALFAALHPRRVKGLILLGTPLHFGPQVGPLDRLAALTPRLRFTDARSDNAPGFLLSAASSTAAPAAFVIWRWWDSLYSLSSLSRSWTHVLVDRWSLDETPLAGRLFREIVEDLYRGDRFMRGTLKINGRTVNPETIDAPLLTVVDEHGDVVPPRATLPFHDTARSGSKTLLHYSGDSGVALRHIGPLVGENAHRRLWPRIVRWMHNHDR